MAIAAGFVDPGNIVAALVLSSYGYTLLWTLVWSTVIGCILQVLSARLGVVSGSSLSHLCHTLPLWPRRVVWGTIQLAIVGSDTQCIVGASFALTIFFPALPLWVGVGLTGLGTFLLLLLEKYGVRKLEAVFGALLLILSTAFIVVSGGKEVGGRRQV
jgi:natural resistance-associated macrophage protein